MIKILSLLILLAPLTGAIIAGIGGRVIGRKASQWITISGILISFVASCYLLKEVGVYGTNAYNVPIYNWGVSGSFIFNVGFLIDRLTLVMMVIVTFVSLLVHYYSIGYMQGDTGYQRFFSYMSLFTFFMLVLVSANNFLLLFFGWEGVGLVSYLLIGFWFQKEAAAQGSLKAFIVNRVGDFGFILGIAAVVTYFGSLDYASVFNHLPLVVGKTISLTPHIHVSVISLICILLFMGAMAKSAQLPLHVWLPESMEGPTPISALIHAATMVTAGVYMVARLSPMFQYSQAALSTVLVIGATSALFLGILAIVQNDIKRIIAYSTMSQLGYMMAANGVSAFSAGIFHLGTHACFKALLFLAAGSVIIALHHEQDIRKMGGLRKYLPVTYTTFLIGALALAAIPPFSGFYSKDAIIEAVQAANVPGARYAYVCLLLGAFFTAFYIFRLFFLTFHTRPRFDPRLKDHLREPTLFMLVPLMILAIPSMLLGMIIIAPPILPPILESFSHSPVWFSIAGIVLAWWFYIISPSLPVLFKERCPKLNWVLINKYGFDALYDKLFVHGALKLSHFFYEMADVKLIDHILVDGAGRNVSRLSAWVRKLQSGYLYHYAFTMIVGLSAFLLWMFI